MKIYLIKTPEYNSESFKDVCELLCSFDGALDFISSEYEFDKEEFPFLKKFNLDFLFKYDSPLKKVNYNNGQELPLSWRELFSLCEYYRSKFNIENTDFVVLLTSRRNALNWFSHCSNKKAFVHTGDWELFTNANVIIQKKPSAIFNSRT